MTIKHGSHTFNMDPVNTDTYRHYHEGQAERVAMISPDKFALVVRWAQPMTPREIADLHMSDADLVLCEGFKTTDLPKIEVFRRAAHDALPRARHIQMPDVLQRLIAREVDAKSLFG